MSYRTGTSGYLGGTGAVLTLTVPAGVVTTDIGLIAMGTTDTTVTSCTVTSSAGTVSTIAGATRPGTQNQEYGFWSITGIAAGATVTLTFNKTCFATAGAGWWTDRGVDATGAVGARTSSATTVSAPTVTSASDGENVACIFVERTTTPGPSTSVTLSGATQRLFVAGEASPACTNSVTLADFNQATGGATPAITATYPAASSNAIGVQIALRNAAPVAAFTASTSALTVSVDGTTSTPVSPATISTYDWDWGDGTTHGSGSTASHTYSAGGGYTIVLTVTDSAALTDQASQSVTVSAPSGSVTAAAVTASTGWTASSGTVLSAITDSDPTTFDSSSANPTALPFELQLQPMTPPATGQPLKVFFTMDATLATTATLNAQLYEGATSRSTLTSVTIPNGSGTTVTGLVTLTFPWTDVQNVTTGGWNAGLTVKLQVTAS